MQLKPKRTTSATAWKEKCFYCAINNYETLYLLGCESSRSWWRKSIVWDAVIAIVIVLDVDYSSRKTAVFFQRKRLGTVLRELRYFCGTLKCRFCLNASHDSENRKYRSRSFEAASWFENIVSGNLCHCGRIGIEESPSLEYFQAKPYRCIRQIYKLLL